MKRERQPETTTITPERIATVSYLPISKEVTLSAPAGRGANILYLPIPRARGLTPDEETQHLYERLEKVEREAETIRRLLGILAVEDGLDG